MMHKNSELTHQVDLKTVYENDEVSLDIRATADECKALAKRFGIPDVEDLNAYVTIRRQADPDLIRIEGEVMAHVVQSCCVTLAPVKETVQESFSDMVTTNPALLKPEEETDEDSEAPVDLIQGDSIDIGEIVIQWLSLALNPYPRSDAPLYEHIEELNKEGTHKPFDILSSLKGK